MSTNGVEFKEDTFTMPVRAVVQKRPGFSLTAWLITIGLAKNEKGAGVIMLILLCISIFVAIGSFVLGSGKPPGPTLEQQRELSNMRATRPR
ncbi:MAG: hypothetical protein AB199_04390 [Parcubacteria bacterium C7867-004]|nr:MAG: hypothetical protein AB199_04390 [Parcubacteria bacterium C7867-004]